MTSRPILSWLDVKRLLRDVAPDNTKVDESGGKGGHHTIWILDDQGRKARKVPTPSLSDGDDVPNYIVDSLQDALGIPDDALTSKKARKSLKKQQKGSKNTPVLPNSE